MDSSGKMTDSALDISLKSGEKKSYSEILKRGLIVDGELVKKNIQRKRTILDTDLSNFIKYAIKVSRF